MKSTSKLFIWIIVFIVVSIAWNFGTQIINRRHPDSVKLQAIVREISFVASYLENELLKGRSFNSEADFYDALVRERKGSNLAFAYYLRLTDAQQQFKNQKTNIVFAILKENQSKPHLITILGKINPVDVELIEAWNTNLIPSELRK